MLSAAAWRSITGASSGIGLRRAPSIWRAQRRRGRARRAARGSARRGGRDAIRGARADARSRSSMDVTRRSRHASASSTARDRGVRPPRHHDLQRRLRLLRDASRRRRPTIDAPDDGRQLHGHVLRRARGAAGLPRAGRGHLIFVSSIVGRRGIAQMSGYSRDQGGAGRVRRVAARGVRGHAASTVSVVYPGLDGHRIPRGDGARLRPHRVRARAEAAGRRRRARDRRLRRRPRPEVYPHRTSRGLAVLNAVAPGFTDRLVQQIRRRERDAAR